MQAAQCVVAAPRDAERPGDAAHDVPSVLRRAATREAAGDLDGARLELEAFFGCHREVGAAWTELRRIYALLARAAYARAMGPAGASATADSMPGRSSAVADRQDARAQAAPVGAGASTPQASGAVQEAAGRRSALPTPEAVSPLPGETPATPQSAVRSAAAARIQSPAGAGDRAEDIVRQLTLDWARAWQARDVDRYLGFYAPGFVGRGAGSPEQWAATRRAVIGRAGEISVRLRDLAISRIDPVTIEVRFRQLYATRRSNLESWKTLVWLNVGGRWGIVVESVERERRR